MRFVTHAILSILLLACDDPDAATSDAGARTDGGPGTDGGGTADGGALDAGEPPPPLHDLPGGPIGDAPVVGCADAERPARRAAEVTETCEATVGRCWYVDAEGATGGDGSFGTPFTSPQEAVRRAGPGDVIYLRGGVYGDSQLHDAEARDWEDSSRGVRRGLLTIGAIGLPTWAGGTAYEVASGTAEAPIVVRSYPGERACAEGEATVRIGSLSVETAYWTLDGLTLRGAPVLVGGGVRGPSGPTNQTHHITLRHLEIYDYADDERQNTGLIRVDRGDWGGPHEIAIESNILHDLGVIEEGVRRDWSETRDAQHFGSVATLSCETYVEPYGECGGNGRLVIRNNHIYRVPSAFFFKNPALGPFEVTGNVIHDIAYLGEWAPSNVTFAGNLVYGSGGAARVGGFGGNEGDLVYARAGRNLDLIGNTFIGFDAVVELRIYASGHTVRGNVIQGLTLGPDDGTWDDMGYIFQARSWVYPDDTGAFAESQLAMDNDFDDNCFVTPLDDFLAYGRRYGEGETPAHLALSEARAMLGFEVSSDTVADPASVFEGFADARYGVREDGPCAGRGATLPSWAR